MEVLRFLAVWACVAALTAGLSGCSSAPAPVVREAEAAPGPRPQDFTLAMTVYAPAAAGALPRSLRAGRYVVEPDGSLRAGLGERAAAYPARTRQLTPGEMDQLWRLVRESALLDPDSPARVEDPGSIAVSPGRAMATVYIAGAGARRTLRVLLDRSSATAVSAERVADRLAEWAWVE